MSLYGKQRLINFFIYFLNTSVHEPDIYWSVRKSALNKIYKMSAFAKLIGYQIINKEKGKK